MRSAFPPGPRGLASLAVFRGPLNFFLTAARTHGPLTYFNILGQRVYLLDDSDLVQEVLVTKQHAFERDSSATFVRELVGDGLVTRNEPAHNERRRQLQPAFHRAQVASYAELMAGECRRFTSRWTAGARIDITAEMRRLTLSIVGACLFSADFSQCADQIADVLTRVVRRGRFVGPLVPLIEPLLHLYRRAYPGGRSLFFQKERADLERILQPVIARRRSAQTNDIVSLLLEQLDDDAASNEIVTLVLAGHESTATALSWAWYLIATHAEVERKLHAEVEEVLGDRQPTFEDLPRLPYTAMVFNEAMRLYPPAPAFGRRPKEAVHLGGYEIPAGANVFLSPYVTHRNPRYFAQPEAFDPSRWQGISLPKFAYFPFGGGAKMCIGDTFARLEAVLVLASISQRFRLVLDEPESTGFNLGFTTIPNRAIWMRPVPVLQLQDRDLSAV